MPRRSKRLKLLHESLSPPISDGLELSSGLWLPDGILFHIYSYISNGQVTPSRYADGVASLIYNTRLISKPFLQSIERYLRSAPLKIRMRFGDDSPRINRRIEWACENCVNVEEFLFDVPMGNDVKSTQRRELFKKILSSCQTSNLVKFGLILPHYSIRRPVNETTMEFQQFVVSNVSNQRHSNLNTPLKKLTVHFNPIELHLPLLTNYSHSLEELEIRICRYAKDRPDELVLSELSDAIKHMPKLKTLKIVNSGKFGAASIQISSDSLEEINVEECDNGFFFEKCSLPSLKVFRCLHKPPSDEQVERKTGLKIKDFPLLTEHMNFKTEPGETPCSRIMVTFDQCSGGKRVRELAGINIPKKCYVFFKVR